MTTVWIQTGTIVSGLVTATSILADRPPGGWPEGWEWLGVSGLWLESTEGLVSGNIITFDRYIPGLVEHKPYYIWTIDTATNIITLSEYGNMQANELADNAIWNTSTGTTSTSLIAADLPIPWDKAVIRNLEDLSVTSGTFTATVFTATPLNATWITSPIAIVSSGTGYTPGQYNAVSLCNTAADGILDVIARATITVNDQGHVSKLTNIKLFDTTPITNGQLLTFEPAEVGETGFGFLAGANSLDIDPNTVVDAVHGTTIEPLLLSVFSAPALLTELDTGITHIPVPAKIVIDLSKAFSTETFFQTITTAYPSDPTLSVVGISIPLVQVECKNIGVINPLHEIKEALSKLYNYCMKAVFQPIWRLLNKLIKALERVLGSIGLNLSLPIFNLSISDLFSNDLYDKVKAGVLNLYYSARAELKRILGLLGIKDPLFTDIASPEVEIEEIIKLILASLWDSLLKLIGQVIGIIKNGLLLWDILTKGKPYPLSPIWQAAIDAFLASILSYFALPPSITSIYEALKAYAESLYKKASATYYDMINALEKFSLPIFGKPFDWILPINVKVNAPNIDLVKMLGDIKSWLGNYLLSFLQKFVRAVVRVLKIFGLSFVVPTIRIPITLCAIRI